MILEASEQPDPKYAALDELELDEVPGTLADDQYHAVKAVQRALPALQSAMHPALECLEAGGRPRAVEVGRESKSQEVSPKGTQSAASHEHDRCAETSDDDA